MRRRPAVAGMFYAADEKSLRREIEEAFLGRLGPGSLPAPTPVRLGRMLGLVSPHAGYMYSGYAAAAAFGELAKDGLPDVAVIIGPNHRAIGAPAAIMEKGTWETPMGVTHIDADVAGTLLRSCGYLQVDERAHVLEHSLEVQVPFLQYLAGDKTTIVPVAIGAPASAEAKVFCRDLGAAIASALEGRQAVVIASTDMTHYESKSRAQAKDALAIKAIEALDSDALIDVVNREAITMCGVVPTAVAIEACKTMGATKAELLTYYTSGDVTGDVGQVVGYAALKIVRE